MGEGHLGTQEESNRELGGQFVKCDNTHAYLRSWRNTPHSRFRGTVTLPPPDCDTQQLTFHAVALEFIFSWSRRKTGFSSLGTAKRGEVPLSDLMAFLSAPQAPVQVTSCALSPAGARLLIQDRKPQTPKFFFPQNDSADVVQTSPRNVSVLSMERLWFEGTGVSHK